ncbi:MAG: maleylpyruvate isomerase family mycothiol-dependent enzyme [Acidobacteriota bacterium]|nr:maleylpyruvate isomerase family mycothiol-dependent enzyme [Acidobacteriota bacterium]
MDTWGRYDAERKALADDLADLEPAQWDTQSLCAEWKVRHVVAHLAYSNSVGVGRFLVGLVKSGFSFDRYMAEDARVTGSAPPESLLAALRATVGVHKAPPIAKPVNMLVDTVCHAADIRRPLGVPRAVPEETLVEVADALHKVGFPLEAKRRVAGVRLVARDAKWTAGDGPVAEGPLESLVLVMSGRRAGLVDLSGDGVGVLETRM